jgi:hypothetical protein
LTNEAQTEGTASQVIELRRNFVLRREDWQLHSGTKLVIRSFSPIALWLVEWAGFPGAAASMPPFKAGRPKV